MIYILIISIVRSTALASDPDIDLIDINAAETLPDVCKGKDCPKYTLTNDANLPAAISVRDYPETYWISTSRYTSVAGSCLEGDIMTRYYQELYNFFKGVNTMGLLIDRTVPIRIIGQMDETGNITFCHTMFYIPEMYSLNTPSPLSVDIFVGYNWLKRCYVISVNGPNTWKRAVRLHKALKKFLLKKEIEDISGWEVILDIYSGYGVPNSKKYSEVMICKDGDQYG